MRVNAEGHSLVGEALALVGPRSDQVGALDLGVLALEGPVPERGEAHLHVHVTRQHSVHDVQRGRV